MQRPEGLARHLDRIVLMICVAISLWVMSWAEATRVERATRWAHWVATPVERVVRGVSDLKDLRRENQELRTRLASLRVDAAFVQAQRDRIEELEQRAGFYDRHRGQLRPATVIELLDGGFEEFVLADLAVLIGVELFHEQFIEVRHLRHLWHLRLLCHRGCAGQNEGKHDLVHEKQSPCGCRRHSPGRGFGDSPAAGQAIGQVALGLSQRTL